MGYMWRDIELKEVGSHVFMYYKGNLYATSPMPHDLSLNDIYDTIHDICTEGVRDNV